MKYWQYMEGTYEPQSPKIGRFYKTGLEDQKILETIAGQKAAMLCINDEGGDQEEFFENEGGCNRSLSENPSGRSSFEQK